MAFTLYSLLQASLLIVNAVAVLHEERFLRHGEPGGPPGLGGGTRWPRRPPPLPAGGSISARGRGLGLGVALGFGGEFPAASVVPLSLCLFFPP